jgi:hypothetical protein
LPKSIELEVYSDAGNHWVVRTPGREFPALVIQGDTLHGIYEGVLEISRRINDCRALDQETRDEAAAMASSLREKLIHYESVLKTAGFPLPYIESVGTGA